MSWLITTLTYADGTKIIHVIPKDDLKPHDETAECWCHPTLDEEDPILIHHSLDRREEYERGRCVS